MKMLKLSSTFNRKLNRLKNPPEHLSYLGSDLSLYNDKKILAVVGTRKPTPYGIRTTKEIVSKLAREGIVIVSGLALGVDCLAHQACLDGNGQTIAVLPSGLDNIYPATNRIIAQDIINSGGTLLSEYTKDHKPKKVEFLERNRIIAALSDAVLITEAAGNSGSLNTANHALQMGIPILAVPGNIDNPMSQGSNFLLKGNASVVTDADDVLKMLGIDSKNSQQSLNLVGQNEQETLVLQKLSKGFTSSEQLQSETKLSNTELQSTLTMLEIESRIYQDQLGNWHIS